MIFFAILATFGAAVWTLFVIFANGMRSSPGRFQGLPSIIAAWVAAGASWLAWWFS